MSVSAQEELQYIDQNARLQHREHIAAVGSDNIKSLCRHCSFAI